MNGAKWASSGVLTAVGKQHPQIEYNCVVAARKRAGALMHQLLWDETTANEALTYWPTLQKGLLPDDSLQVAYQLVWHFECDEGMAGQGPRYTELFYMDIQLELLKQCAGYLLAGHPLPQDIITCYTYYEPPNRWQPQYFKPKPLATMELMAVEYWLREQLVRLYGWAKLHLNGWNGVYRHLPQWFALLRNWLLRYIKRPLH